MILPPKNWHIPPWENSEHLQVGPVRAGDILVTSSEKEAIHSTTWRIHPSTLHEWIHLCQAIIVPNDDIATTHFQWGCLGVLRSKPRFLKVVHPWSLMNGSSENDGFPPTKIDLLFSRGWFFRVNYRSLKLQVGGKPTVWEKQLEQQLLAFPRY